MKSRIDNKWYVYIFRMRDLSVFICSAEEELIKTEVIENTGEKWGNWRSKCEKAVVSRTRGRTGHEQEKGYHF